MSRADFVADHLLPTISLLGAQHIKEIVWRTSRQACLLCPWARHLTGRLHLYVADRWPSRTSRVTIVKLLTQHVRRLLGTHQWQSALLVVGLPVTQDWFEMGCHLSPSLISIRLTATMWSEILCSLSSWDLVTDGRNSIVTTTA